MGAIHDFPIGAPDWRTDRERDAQRARDAMRRVSDAASDARTYLHAASLAAGAGDHASYAQAMTYARDAVREYPHLQGMI